MTGTDKIVDHNIIEDETPAPVLFKLLNKKLAFADGRAANIVI